MDMNRIAILLLFLPVSLLAQSNRYFVSFKDKANSVYSISNPLQFLTQKSIDRRTRENFLMTEEDIPVNGDYVHQVKATGAEVYFRSRWFNGVLIQANASLLTTILALPFVSNVERVAWGTRLTGGRVGVDQKFEEVNSTTTLVNQAQLQMIGLDQMQAEGYHGEGVDIAVFDSGFNGVNMLSAFSPLYQEGRVKQVFNFVQNSTNVYAGYPHGTMVLSIMAGNVPGTYLGGVDKANYFLYQTEDAYSEFRVEEYNWLFAAEKADSAGIDVINSSLGYFQFDDPSMDYTYNDLDGKTSVVARAARKVFERGIVVVNAAGNEGDGSWKYIITPADAEGIIACGGVDASRSYVGFSSIGPSSDKRIKPDVSAMAAGAEVIGSSGSIGTGSGTSFASPLVACLAAGLRQALPNASAYEIYDRIISSASQATHPDNKLGYGIPDFGKAKNATEFVNGIGVYPNPTKDIIKLIFKGPEGEQCSITLFNSSGQKVIEVSAPVSWENNPYQIDASHFASGLYYLLITTTKATRTEKIVIQH